MKTIPFSFAHAYVNVAPGLHCLCLCLCRSVNQASRKPLLRIGPGARFSKARETFRARKVIANSRTLRLLSNFIHIFLI